MELITKQMESDQAWTKNRLDDMGRLVTMLNLDDDLYTREAIY